MNKKDREKLEAIFDLLDNATNGLNEVGKLEDGLGRDVTERAEQEIIKPVFEARNKLLELFIADDAHGDEENPEWNW